MHYFKVGEQKELSCHYRLSEWEYQVEILDSIKSGSLA